MIWGTASCRNAMKSTSMYASWNQHRGSEMTTRTSVWCLTIKALHEKGFVCEHAIILHRVDVCICCGERESAKLYMCTSFLVITIAVHIVILNCVHRVHLQVCRTHLLHVCILLCNSACCALECRLLELHPCFPAPPSYSLLPRFFPFSQPLTA